jgi:hypothetical protein
MVRSESDFATRANLCHLIVTFRLDFAMDRSEDPIWPFVLDLSRELLSGDGFAIGLHLLSEIPFDFCDTTEFYGYAFRGVEAGEREIRIAALRLLTQLIAFAGGDVSPMIEPFCEDFPGLVCEMAGRGLGSDAVESALVFEFIGLVCEGRHACFVDSQRGFVESVLDAIGNCAISPYVRLPAARAISSAFPAVEDSIVAIIERAVAFAVELAVIDPAAGDFAFLRDYVEEVRFFLDRAAAAKIYGLACRLLEMGGEPEALVSLSIFQGIVSFPLFPGSELAEEIGAAVIASLAHNGQAVAEAAGTLTIALCEVAPDELQLHANDLAIRLLDHLTNLRCANALEDLLKATSPLESADALLERLLQILAGAPLSHVPALIGILRELLAGFDSIDETIFPRVHPVLFALLSRDAEAQALAVRTFPSLLRTAPRSAVGAVGEFVGRIESLLGRAGPTVDDACVRCIAELLDLVAPSLEPLAEPLFSALESILVRLGDHGDAEEEDADEACVIAEIARANCLTAMAALCAQFPSQCRTHEERILDLLFAQLYLGDEQRCAPAGAAIADIGAINPAPIIERLLAQTVSEPPAIAAVWRAITGLVPALGVNALAQIAGHLTARLAAALPGRMEPVFSALTELARALGTAFPAEQFVPALQEMMDVEPLAAPALAEIGAAVGDLTLLMEAVAALLPVLLRESAGARRSAFEAAASAVRAAPEELAGAQESLLMAASRVISRQGESPAVAEAAAVLWIAVTRAYDLDVQDDDFAALLASTGIGQDSPLLLPLCEFVATGTAPERSGEGLLPALSAAVLASKDWIVARVDPVFMRLLAECAVTNTEEVEEALGFNQNAIQRVQRAVQAALS